MHGEMVAVYVHNGAYLTSQKYEKYELTSNIHKNMSFGYITDTNLSSCHFVNKWAEPWVVLL